jgi:cytochrome c peroxidase
MSRCTLLSGCMLAFGILLAVAPVSQAMTPTEELGRFLYFDEDLSTPPGMSCASCHDPDAGFADPDTDVPVSQGIVPTRFGNRNSPSAAYAAFSPVFHYDEDEGLYVGGQFWDGRAATLADQAKGPFLNPLEMKNPNKRAVVRKVSKSDYAALFLQVYGPHAFDDIEEAYDGIAEAIAAFETTGELNQFSSKYDHYLAGEVDLTAQESFGLSLYEDPAKGNCAACHPSEPGPSGEPPLFTDFTYDNLGVPRNADNPFYFISDEFNPDGEDFIDYGLGGVLGLPEEMGKVKVPTLRNIAVTPPYMHNGALTSLTDVVDFYNTRDVPGAGWPPPEVPENVNTDELGDLGLSASEVDAIVAFLETLTDGCAVPVGREAYAAGEPDRVLDGVSPNPFNPRTQVSFSLPEGGDVRLVVYDIAGREVAVLADGNMDAGRHAIAFDGSGLASGVYFARLETAGAVEQRKMVLMK